MVGMSRTSSRLRIALVAILVVACAGPPPTTPAESSASTPPVASIATTPSPSIEPEPTAAVYPLRTEVEINSPIVERPGVPPDMHDLYWWTGNGDAGQVGTTAQIGLPAGEQIVGVADGVVVALRDALEVIPRLVVRDFATGSVVEEISLNVIRPRVQLVGRRLFWAGMDPATGDDDDPAIDGGVWSVDIGSGDASFEIVKPGRDVSSLRYPSRGFFRVSPSGKTVTSPVGREGEGFVDVIDVGTRNRRARLRDTFIWGQTDDTYFNWDFTPEDFQVLGYGITAYDLEISAVRWRFPERNQVDQFAPEWVGAVGSMFVVQYVWHESTGAESVTAVFDAVSGDRREMLREPGGGNALTLKPDLSTDAHLAFTRFDGPRPGVVPEGSPISIVDIATGVLTRDAFTIDTPWLCFDEYCLRD